MPDLIRNTAIQIWLTALPDAQYMSKTDFKIGFSKRLMALVPSSLTEGLRVVLQIGFSAMRCLTEYHKALLNGDQGEV